MTRRKIVLQFISGADEDNNYRYKKKTLRNIRPDSTDEQMIELIQRFCTFTAYPLAEAVVVDERVLIHAEEKELIEVIPQEEQESIFLKEEESDPTKGLMTASFKENEATLVTNIETAAVKPQEPKLKDEETMTREKNASTLNPAGQTVKKSTTSATHAKNK